MCGRVLQKDLELRKLLETEEYSLNTVSNYGDSLLHVSAASGYAKSVQTILKQNENCDIDRKNKFGWTPLMHAIRANSIETVSILLKWGADVTHRSYLGISALSLAAGMSLEMFEVIYKACPSMLETSVHDDISPLCVAAMKNDKNLFLKLLDMGLEVKNESVYTHLVMQKSVIPEIRSLAEIPVDVEKYWSDKSGNITIQKGVGSGDGSRIDSCIHVDTTAPSICVTTPQNSGASNQPRVASNSLQTATETKLPNLELLHLRQSSFEDNRSISPNLVYNLDSWFAKSPNLWSSSNNIGTSHNQPMTKFLVNQKFRQHRNVFVFDDSATLASSRVADIGSSQPKADVHNVSLTFTPEFSPTRSPCLPSDFEEEDVCGEDTPTPPHYKTPPQGMVLNSEQAKLVIILKQFDLAHHISIFLAQEVDMGLFLTLNEQDLTEIGIENERDRKAVLAVIDAYVKEEKY